MDISNSPLTYSPAPFPASPGEVVILTTAPHNGYCGVLVQVATTLATVRLLDAEPDTPAAKLVVDLNSLIPSGKTPAELLGRFTPSDSQLSAALDAERQMPDMTKTVKRHAASRRPATPKSIEEELSCMSADEKRQVAALIAARLAALD